MRKECERGLLVADVFFCWLRGNLVLSADKSLGNSDMVAEPVDGGGGGGGGGGGAFGETFYEIRFPSV